MAFVRNICYGNKRQLEQPGHTWKSDGDEIESTILAIENVTVPAGTFTGCLKIRHRCTSCSGSADWIEWVKPGFFMVKWVDYWDDNAASYV